MNNTTNTLGIPLLLLTQGSWLAACPTRVQDFLLLKRACREVVISLVDRCLPRFLLGLRSIVLASQAAG